MHNYIVLVETWPTSSEYISIVLLLVVLSHLKNSMNGKNSSFYLSSVKIGRREMFKPRLIATSSCLCAACSSFEKDLLVIFLCFNIILSRKSSIYRV